MSLSVKDVDFGDQKIIYIQAPSTDTPAKRTQVVTEWTEPATEELLKILPKYLEAFLNRTINTKRQLYESISLELEQKGWTYSGPQCENKWKCLRRTYISRFEKGALLSYGPNRFSRRARFEDAIETVLKLEKPSFKQQIDELNKSNLNLPPGFTKKESEEEAEEEEDENEIQFHEYDDSLVEKILREDPEDLESQLENHNAGDCSNPVSRPSKRKRRSENNDNQDEDAVTINATLIEEVGEMRKVIQSNLKVNEGILKNHNATYEQILMFLDCLEKREEEKLKLEREKLKLKQEKLERHEDMVQQIKIQNSLLAKLIQRMPYNQNK